MKPDIVQVLKELARRSDLSATDCFVIASAVGEIEGLRNGYELRGEVIDQLHSEARR